MTELITGFDIKIEEAAVRAAIKTPEDIVNHWCPFRHGSYEYEWCAWFRHDNEKSWVDAQTQDYGIEFFGAVFTLVETEVVTSEEVDSVHEGDGMRQNKEFSYKTTTRTWRKYRHESGTEFWDEKDFGSEFRIQSLEEAIEKVISKTLRVLEKRQMPWDTYIRTYCAKYHGQRPADPAKEAEKARERAKKARQEEKRLNEVWEHKRQQLWRKMHRENLYNNFLASYGLKIDESSSDRIVRCDKAPFENVKDKMSPGPVFSVPLWYLPCTKEAKGVKPADWPVIAPYRNWVAPDNWRELVD